MNWRRPSGCPHTMWMKTIQQGLKSNNLFLNEAWLRTVHSEDILTSMFDAMHY